MSRGTSQFPWPLGDVMGSRIVILLTSPRLPAGLMTAQAWDTVRNGRVYAASESDHTAALRASGVRISLMAPSGPGLLRLAAEQFTVVWLAGPSGDEELARDLGFRLAREPGLAEMEVMYGSWDPHGARLLDVVGIVERLIAPGGDPWLSTHAASRSPHETFAQYLLEEAYEAYDAMRSGDASSLREELGDVLFQVILHAKLGSSSRAASARSIPARSRQSGGPIGVAQVGVPRGDNRFTIDDVAGDLVAKLIRRNPHVFGNSSAKDLGEITRNWNRIKRDEKSRKSSMDGITLTQPALALAAKVLDRAESVDPELSRPASAAVVSPEQKASLEAELGDRLFSLVEQARAAGVDAEAALRRVVLDLMEAIRSEEAAQESA